MGKNINIVGCIGCGKSSVVDELGVLLPSYTIIKENFERVASLPAFYEEEASKSFSYNKHAFRLQIEFLSQYLFNAEIMKNSFNFIMDAGPHCGKIFVGAQKDAGIMSTEEFRIYGQFERQLWNFMMPAYEDTVVVYLRVTPHTAFQRANSRGRDMEKQIPIDYFQNLIDYWDDFAVKSGSCNILDVDNIRPRAAAEIIYNEFFE